MKISPLSDHFLVGPQLEVADIDELKRRGIRGVICNRPDGETHDQPSHTEIESALRDAGIEFRYIPVVPDNITEADTEAFIEAEMSLAKPIYAFCRTGTRSATLWSYARLGHTPHQDILRIAKEAGYDLSKALDKSKLAM